MKRLLPAPLLSLVLGVAWLALMPSFTPHNLAAALALAIGIPLACAPLRPTPVRIRRPWTIVALVMTVGRDVIVSNFAVARGVVFARRHPARPAFVTIPLALRDPNALAALAIITTVVPGTVWCELARDRSALRLHVFDLADEATFIAEFKARYEARLAEIFE
jgi:multicomponent K+:H+ antiporter subunit E